MTDDTVIRRAGALGVHSILQFSFSVPALADAERFFTAFGLDARRVGDRVELYAHGNPHRWGVVHEGGARKRLEYLSFGAYEQDLPMICCTTRGFQAYKGTPSMQRWT